MPRKKEKEGWGRRNEREEQGPGREKGRESNTENAKV